MDCTKEDIKKRIIIRLVKWRKWGGSHTENIIGGLPSHLKGAKATKQALKELERDDWLLSAKKTGEAHYSLNPETRENRRFSVSQKSLISVKTDDILRFYEKYCNK